MKTLVAIAIALVASRTASADPTLPRVVTAPTAWLLPDGSAYGTGAVNVRPGDGAVDFGSIDVGYGLGGIAELDVGADTDARECDAPPCAVNGMDNLPVPQYLARAGFRIGAPQDRLFNGQPALVLGARKTFGHTHEIGEVYFVASRSLGPIRLHAGVAAMDARHGLVRMTAQIRPIAGLEMTPPQYPKTTLMGDISWSPRFVPDQAMPPGPTPEWAIGWGVRYQALRWGSIELDGRHRGKGNDAEGLGATTLMIRVNGVWELGGHQ
ncbi:MAG: hypothetical protein JWO36_6124 [Myxococcales bacterium]|nr:hypothetical protein [Myxococcales bacterium]